MTLISALYQAAAAAVLALLIFVGVSVDLTIPVPEVITDGVSGFRFVMILHALLSGLLYLLFLRAALLVYDIGVGKAERRPRRFDLLLMGVPAAALAVGLAAWNLVRLYS